MIESDVEREDRERAEARYVREKAALEARLGMTPSHHSVPWLRARVEEECDRERWAS